MKTKKMTAMLFAMLAVGCSQTTTDGNVNYEFETFEGQKVSLCETNICYQHNVPNVQESQIVPKEAVVVAPGRDYVYLQDANYYYVEDASRNLLTIARRDTATATLLLDQSFLVSYRNQSFTKNINGDSVVLVYTKEGVQSAGSNYVQFTVVDQPSCQTYLQQTVQQNGGTPENISESTLTGVRGTVYSYLTVGESDLSGLRVVFTLYAVPCGEKTLAIEVYRTVGPDDEVEMAVDADFEQIFQSFLSL